MRLRPELSRSLGIIAFCDLGQVKTLPSIPPRFAFVAQSLRLPPDAIKDVLVLTKLIHDRLLRKRARLHTALPGLSFEGTDAVLALSCGKRRWRSVLQTLHEPADFKRLTPGKWNLEEVLAGALEVEAGDS